MMQDATAAMNNCADQEEKTKPLHHSLPRKSATHAVEARTEVLSSPLVAHVKRCVVEPRWVHHSGSH